MRGRRCFPLPTVSLHNFTCARVMCLMLILLFVFTISHQRSSNYFRATAMRYTSHINTTPIARRNVMAHNACLCTYRFPMVANGARSISFKQVWNVHSRLFSMKYRPAVVFIRTRWTYFFFSILFLFQSRGERRKNDFNNFIFDFQFVSLLFAFVSKC